MADLACSDTVHNRSFYRDGTYSVLARQFASCIQMLNLPAQEHHIYFLAVGVVLELVGAVLFILNWSIGALALLLYTAAITPVAHDFWNSSDETVRGLEIVHFMKVGARVICARPS